MAALEQCDDMLQALAKRIKSLEASIVLQKDLAAKIGDQYFRHKYGVRPGEILLDDNDQEYRFLFFSFSLQRVLYEGWSLEDFSNLPPAEVVMIKPDGTIGKLAYSLFSWRKKGKDDDAKEEKETAEERPEEKAVDPAPR